MSELFHSGHSNPVVTAAPDVGGGHRPEVLAGYITATLQASKAVATAGSANETAVTGLGGFREAMILLDVTVAAAAVGDTLDVYVDTSPDGGLTWVNVIHFPQVLGNGGAKQFWAVLDPGGAPGTATIAVATDAAAGVVRPSMFTDQLRVRHVVVDGGAHGQSFTFAVVGAFKG